MIRKIASVLLAVVFLASCVPQRKYQYLETAYKELEKNNKECGEQLKASKEEQEKLKTEKIALSERLSKLVADSLETHTLFETNKKLYGELKDSYEKLIRNNQLAEQRLAESLKELEAKLMVKERDLAAKEARLNDQENSNQKLKTELEGMKADLQKEQARVYELQNILNAKDSAVKSLKAKLSNALLGFKDKGLSVEIKNGKVYVSLEEQLLFASASIVVDKKGKEALLELAKSLQDIKDINIMVEGHTDDVPMQSGQIKDNWDLSVLRATSIVRILTVDGKVDPKILIASGRGEHFPIEAAKTKEARAKNRRTEIIITPKLDEVFQLLNQD